MNRIDRLTGTLLLLQSHASLSLASIASHWEVSERTVYRDIAALCEAGVPIVFEPQRGYRLLGGYEVPPVMFSEDEALALFLSAAISEKVADASLRNSIRSALVKIRSVLPDERKSLLNGFKESLGIWIYGQAPCGQIDCLLPLHHAVLRRRCIALQYDTASQGKITKRVVEPLAVLYYAANWHLIAYCRLRKDYRDFRMDRVRHWEALDSTFAAHPHFSVDTFVSQWDCAEPLTMVQVCVEAGEVDRFRRTLHAGHFEAIELTEGRVRFRFHSHASQGISHWMLSFGSSLKVEHPASLAEEVRAMALEVAERYASVRV